MPEATMPAPAAQPVVEIHKSGMLDERPLFKLTLTRDSAGIHLKIAGAPDFSVIYDGHGPIRRVTQKYKGHYLLAGIDPNHCRPGMNCILNNETGQLLPDGYLNLSFLGVPQIRQEAVFDYANQVASAEMLKKCAIAIRNAMVWLYREHLRPVNVEMEVTLRERGI